MTRLTKWMLLGALLLAAAALGWWLTQSRAETGKRYRTEKLDRGMVTQTVSANGTLNPVKLINVGTQVSGTVKKLNVDYNDRVEVGQVLMVLDDALFSAAVRQSEANVANAQATLSLAQANVSRIEALFKQEFVSRQELDESRKAAESARAGVAQARAQLDRDRINLSNTIIRSPVSGVVVAREVDVGQTVAASFQTPTLFRIAQDLTKMQIDSNFAEADVGQIKVGQAVRFRVDAFADRQFSGSVRQVRLNPTTVQNVVTYNVVVAVDNPDYQLLPGMTAYVTVEVASREDVWRIPNAALRFKPVQAAPAEGGDKRRGGRGKGEANRATVHVLRGGEAVPVPVVIGISNGRYTEFVSGEIKPEDALVVEDLSVAARSQQAGGQPPTFRMRMF